MPGKEIKGRSKIANYRYGGRTGFKEGTNNNGPVRPIEPVWPEPDNPVPSKRVSKKFSEKWTKKNKKRRIGKRRAT